MQQTQMYVNDTDKLVLRYNCVTILCRLNYAISHIDTYYIIVLVFAVTEIFMIFNAFILLWPSCQIFPAAFNFNHQSGFTSLQWEKILLCRLFAESFGAYGIKLLSICISQFYYGSKLAVGKCVVATDDILPFGRKLLITCKSFVVSIDLSGT